MGAGTQLGRVRGLGSAKHGAGHWWLQRVTDAVFHLPIAVPSVAIGLGLLIAFNEQPLLLGGTRWIVILAHAVLVLAFAFSAVSAALDLAYVASGRFDGYWHHGFQPWDVAAGLVLVREAGSVVTRDDLMREVWGAEWWGSTKTLDMHISWLRRKLGDDATDPRRITTVRGVGFRFETGTES